MALRDGPSLGYVSQSLDRLSLPPTRTLHVRLRAVQQVRLPGWLGSTLHGALGHALSRLADTGGLAEAACELLVGARSEGSSALGATSRSLALIPPPPAEPRTLSVGESLDFRIVLIGEGGPAVEALVRALAGMAEGGLGSGQGTLSLESVRATSGVVAQAGRFVMMPGPDPEDLPWLGPVSELVLRTRTPLFLRVAGELIEEPSFAQVCEAALRRAVTLAESFGPPAQALRITEATAAAERAVTEEQGDWGPFRARRWSNRQKQGHEVVGSVGALHVRGELEAWALLLRRVSRFGIGKGTAMGLGHFGVEQV